jgi:hypothetical protein
MDLEERKAVLHGDSSKAKHIAHGKPTANDLLALYKAQDG